MVKRQIGTREWCNESRQAMENSPTSTTTANLAPPTLQDDNRGRSASNNTPPVDRLYQDAAMASFIAAKLSA
ncbi:MAG: hypothetical protein ACJZ78_00790 [Prochlorococcus marinus]